MLPVALQKLLEASEVFFCDWLQLFPVVVLCCFLCRLTVQMQKQGMVSGMQFYLKYILNVENALKKLCNLNHCP